ncbi:unnamed protein product [Meloidogyne enterolobii]|uniref:Uncharacterized protein n=1 Tax=Meloidogyne enterolobii TaxID=390850 RepID=A0ACB0YND4_MELEN
MKLKEFSIFGGIWHKRSYIINLVGASKIPIRKMAVSRVSVGSKSVRKCKSCPQMTKIGTQILASKMLNIYPNYLC